MYFYDLQNKFHELELDADCDLLPPFPENKKVKPDIKVIRNFSSFFFIHKTHFVVGKNTINH